MMAPRGFAFAFEPLLTRRQWDLDAQLVQMGQLIAALRRARDALTRAEAQAQAQSVSLRLQWDSRANPAAYGVSLRHMVATRAEQATLRAEIERLERALAEARARVAKVRAHMDSLQQRRGEELAAFLHEQARKEHAEADDAWLRAQVRAVVEVPA
jgi:uncharacterized coiled-coil protein SlyX